MIQYDVQINTAITEMHTCKPTFHDCEHPCAGIEMLSDLWTEVGTETSIEELVKKVRATVVVDALADAIVGSLGDRAVDVGIDM